MTRLSEWGVAHDPGYEDLVEMVRDYDLGFVGNYIQNARKRTDAPVIFHVGCGLTLLSGLLGPAIRIGDSQLTMWVLLLGVSPDDAVDKGREPNRC